MYHPRSDTVTASLFFTARPSSFAPAPASRPSSLGGQGASAPDLRRQRRSLSRGSRATGSCAAVLGLALVMLAVATLVAPEQPLVHASICERHHGVAACRVW